MLRSQSCAELCNRWRNTKSANKFCRAAKEKLIAFGTETSGNENRDKNECVIKKSVNEEKGEIEKYSEISVGFSDLSEEFFDDAEVDEIIRAYERECIRVLEKDKEKDEVDAKQEFPLPEASVARTATARESSSDTFGAITKPDVAQFIPDANYEIRYADSRGIILVVNITYYSYYFLHLPSASLILF